MGLNKLILFTVALLGTACAHHPTYVAPGDREVTEQAATPQDLAARPTDLAVPEQVLKLTQDLAARDEEISALKVENDELKSKIDLAALNAIVSNDKAMRAMYESLKDFMFEQCMNAGCGFSLPGYEFMRMRAGAQFEARHD